MNHELMQEPAIQKLEMARGGMVMHKFGHLRVAGGWLDGKPAGFNMEYLGVSFVSYGGSSFSFLSAAASSIVFVWFQSFVTGIGIFILFTYF
jgi:hypothetical protein